jgi:hypothetical protein
MEELTRNLAIAGAVGALLGFITSYLLSSCKCRECPGNCKNVKEAPKKA